MIYSSAIERKSERGQVTYCFTAVTFLIVPNLNSPITRPSEEMLSLIWETTVIDPITMAIELPTLPHGLHPPQSDRIIIWAPTEQIIGRVEPNTRHWPLIPFESINLLTRICIPDLYQTIRTCSGQLGANRIITQLICSNLMMGINLEFGFIGKLIIKAKVNIILIWVGGRVTYPFLEVISVGDRHAKVSSTYKPYLGDLCLIVLLQDVLLPYLRCLLVECIGLV